MRHIIMMMMLWLPALVQAASVPVPALHQRVTDQTGILSPAEREQLNVQIVQLEQQTGHQLVLLTVNTTGDDSIEQYATRVFEQWKPGNKQRDDGVLLLVAAQDRTVRIEVGYGLEGTLTDLQASQIICGQMLPAFRLGDFPQGISRGAGAIAGLLAQPVTRAAETLTPAVPIAKNGPQPDHIPDALTFWLWVAVHPVTGSRRPPGSNGMLSVAWQALTLLPAAWRTPVTAKTRRSAPR